VAYVAYGANVAHAFDHISLLSHISHFNRKTRRRDINKRKKCYFNYNLYLFDITRVMTKRNDENIVIFTNKCHFLNYENKESF
jgi:hypothetical protein